MKNCGECTLCCKLMAIEELSKPVGVWCEHCKVGSGCGIYADRPPSCQTFRCMWLDQEVWPDELRPDKSGVLFFIAEERPDQVQAKCDPNRPLAFERGEAKRAIDTMTNGGYDVLMTIGSKRKYFTTNTARARELERMRDRGEL